jgi:hypothetical protein
LCRRLGVVARRGETAPDFEGDFLFNGAGVGLLLGNAEFRQEIENDTGLDLKLSGQLVDA